MTSPHGTGDRRWGATLALSFGQLVSWGTLYYAYATFAPDLADSLGISTRAVALGFSLSLLTSGLLARRVGRQLDVLGARRILFFGAVLGPVALLAIASVDGFPALLLAFAVLGVAQALSLYESAFRAVVAWFPEDAARRRALLVVTSIGGFASTVFVPLTATLVLALGWREAMVALACVLAMVGLPTALLVPTSPTSPTSPTLPRADIAPAQPPEMRPHLENGTRRLAFAFGIQAFASAAVAVALIWHLVSTGMPVMRAAFITGLAGAAQVPGRLLIGFAQDQIDDAWRLPLGFWIQAFALTAIAFGRGTVQLIAILMFGAISGAMTLERAAITAKLFGTERFGAASGEIAAVSLVARAVAPFAVEAARGAMGYDITLSLIAALVAVAGLSFAEVPAARPQPHAPPR